MRGLNQGDGGTPDAPGARDLRRYARGTQARLIVGAFLLLFVVGGGLIYLFYGPGGAALGIFCLLAALLPVGLIAVGLWIIDRLVRRERAQDGHR